MGKKKLKYHHGGPWEQWTSYLGSKLNPYNYGYPTVTGENFGEAFRTAQNEYPDASNFIWKGTRYLNETDDNLGHDNEVYQRIMNSADISQEHKDNFDNLWRKDMKGVPMFIGDNPYGPKGRDHVDSWMGSTPELWVKEKDRSDYQLMIDVLNEFPHVSQQLEKGRMGFWGHYLRDLADAGFSQNDMYEMGHGEEHDAHAGHLRPEYEKRIFGYPLSEMGQRHAYDYDQYGWPENLDEYKTNQLAMYDELYGPKDLDGWFGFEREEIPQEVDAISYRKGGTRGCYECGGYFEGGGYVPFMPTRQTYLEGGVATPLPGGATEFTGRTHEEGGILLDEYTEVEDGETMDKIKGNDYFFSNHLKLGGKTFAVRHKQLLNAGATQQQIEELADIQEKVAGRDKYNLGGERKRYANGGPKVLSTDEGVIESLQSHGYATERIFGLLKKYDDEDYIFPVLKTFFPEGYEVEKIGIRGNGVRITAPNGEEFEFGFKNFGGSDNSKDATYMSGVNTLRDFIIETGGEGFDRDVPGFTEDGTPLQYLASKGVTLQAHHQELYGTDEAIREYMSQTDPDSKYYNANYDASEGTQTPGLTGDDLPEDFKTYYNDIKAILDEKGISYNEVKIDPDNPTGAYVDGKWMSDNDIYGSLEDSGPDDSGGGDRSSGSRIRFPRQGEILGFDDFKYSDEIPNIQGAVKFGDRTIYLDDPELLESIKGVGGLDEFMDVWYNNANPEVLEAAGLTGVEDLFANPYQDEKGRTRYPNWGKYQEAWNKINPDKLIEVDDSPGEQTLSTGFVFDRLQEQPINIPTIPLQPLPTKELKLPPFEKQDLTNIKDPNVKPPPSEGGKNWNDPKKPFPWDTVLGVGAGALQLIPAIMAMREKPDYMGGPDRLGTTHLERVAFNDALAANAANYRGMSRFIENSGLGPAGIANKMASWRAKQEGDMKIEGEEARQNAMIANQEAQINQQSRLHNIKNRMYVDEFNRAADAATKDRRLMAVQNAVQTLASMNNDRMQYKANRELARAISGETGVGERFNQEWGFRKANPQLTPGTEDYKKALNEYYLSIADPEAYEQNQNIENQQLGGNSDPFKRMGGRRRYDDGGPQMGITQATAGEIVEPHPHEFPPYTPQAAMNPLFHDARQITPQVVEPVPEIWPQVAQDMYYQNRPELTIINRRGGKRLKRKKQIYG